MGLLTGLQGTKFYTVTASIHKVGGILRERFDIGSNLKREFFQIKTAIRHHYFQFGGCIQPAGAVIQINTKPSHTDINNWNNFDGVRIYHRKNIILNPVPPVFSAFVMHGSHLSSLEVI